MDQLRIPKDDSIKHYSPLIFRFLKAGEDSSQMPNFIKDAIMEKQRQMMLEARKAYISQNNEFYRKRDKKLTDYSNDCTSILKKYPDNDLLNSWSTMEKDTLKKHLLQFGYGRWKKIRKFSAS